MEIAIGIATIIAAVAGVIALKPLFQKKRQSGINEALEKELQQSIIGYKIVTKDGGTHSYQHPSLPDQSLTLIPKPEPTEHARELAEKIPNDADSYSRALKAIAGKDLEKARGLLDEAEKSKEKELIKIYETRGLTEYYDGCYVEAAEWFRKLLHFKPDDLYWLNVTTKVSNQAGEYEAGVPLAKRSLKISENRFGSDHEEVATSLNNLAGLYYRQGLYDKAEPLYERALEIRKSVLGEQHPDVATSLNNLAGLYDSQGHYDKAEPLVKRALKIRKDALGIQHPSVATSMNNLASLYSKQGLYDKAEPYYQRTIQILETVSPNNPNLVTGIMNYAKMLEESGHEGEAKVQFQKAEAIKAKQADQK